MASVQNYPGLSWFDNIYSDPVKSGQPDFREGAAVMLTHLE